jgi:hypothetical protein
MAALLVERPSVVVGETIKGLAVVVNETGADLSATLRIEARWNASDVESLTLATAATWPADGVIQRPFSLPARSEPGQVVLRLLLEGPDLPDGERSTERHVLVLDGPPDEPLLASPVWTAPGDEAARGFLDRWGLETGAAPGAAPFVALVGQPGRLREQLPLAEWLALWQRVHAGGAAVVLLPDPEAGPLAAVLGPSRGVTTLSGLPVPLGSGGAAGNFMGRIHVVDEAGNPRLLGRGDEVLSPRAMVVGSTPEGTIPRMLTIGHLGQRVGLPELVVPFGRGTIHVSGLPLLDPLDGRVEPRRDAHLADLLTRAAAAALSDPPPWTPPGDDDLEDMAEALERIDRVVALGDRSTPYTTERFRLPETLSIALRRRQQALELLFQDRGQRCRELLQQVAEATWSPSIEQLLAVESRVIERLARRLASTTPQDRDRAHEALELWARAMAAWSAGDAQAALTALAEAERALGDA